MTRVPLPQHLPTSPVIAALLYLGCVHRKQGWENCLLLCGGLLFIYFKDLFIFIVVVVVVVVMRQGFSL